MQLKLTTVKTKGCEMKGFRAETKYGVMFIDVTDETDIETPEGRAKVIKDIEECIEKSGSLKDKEEK